jgi:hypothetical protein
MPPLSKQPRPDHDRLALVNEVNFGAMGRKVQKCGLVQSGASWMPESQIKTFYLTVLFQICNKKSVLAPCSLATWGSDPLFAAGRVENNCTKPTVNPVGIFYAPEEIRAFVR